MSRFRASYAALLVTIAGLTACTADRSARLGPSRPLLYADGPDAASDRPAHVRAASAVVGFGGDLAVIQDDAHFVARVRGSRVGVIALPAGEGGKRLFDDGRGNKAAKLDLEASLVLAGPGGTRLVGFGSGSSPRRESLVLVDEATERVEIRDASAIYLELRAHPILAGAELNIEGAVAFGEIIRLFQRGNGKSRGGEPVNATIDLDRGAFDRWLAGDGAAPAPIAVVRHDLGRVQGVPYGFTDATLVGSEIVFVAVAEDSPDAVRDGAVVGVAIGTWRGGAIVMTPLIEADGSPCTRKIEGIAPDPDAPGKLVAVTDVDDHARPAELSSLELVGFW
jgi:hypothetical protein